MIFDLHNDFPTSLTPDELAVYARDVCGDNTVVAVIWTSDFPKDVAAEKVCAIVAAIRRETCGKRFPVSIEDLGFLRGDELDTFDYSDFFYCSLTWNYNNVFAGGALDDGALTADGRRLIELLNGKCAVDLAHLNKKSFYSALELAERPLCSHTGFNGHLRSLDDAQIRALIERRAIIGLCTVTAFSGATTANEFATVIDRFVQKYGADNLAVGTDFNGSKDIPPDLSDYNAVETVKRGLIDRGYGSDAVNKIFYQNAQDFFNRER